MKMIAFAFASLFALMANADDASLIVTGLNCTMEYKQGGVLEAYSSKSSAWLVDGETLSSDVKSADNDGFPTELAANTLEVSQIKVKGQDFWQVTILDADLNVVGISSFPYAHGQKVTLPVKAVDNESEDPAQFSVLEVTCKLVPFAG